MPGTTLSWPSVLKIDRSAAGVKVSVSVLLLLPPVGSVTPAGGLTVAVLFKEPVRVGAMATVNWKPAVPLGASVPVVKCTVFVPAS